MKKYFHKKDLILIILLLTTPQLMSQKTLDIDQAIKIAYKNRPSLKAFKFAIQASKSNEKAAISGYLPQLTLSSQENYSTGSRGLQNSTTLQASQLIYSFAGPERLKRIARRGTEISELYERNHKDLIRYEVEVSFLQTWLLQEKNRVINSLDKTAKETIKKSEHQNELELLGQNDWLKDASTYATNMSNVYLFIDELSSSASQLEYLLGEGYEKENQYLEWNYKTPIKIYTLGKYYGLALKSRKEIKLKEKEAAKYDEYQKYYKNNYLPELSVSGQVSRVDQVKGNNVGLNLSWKLFDGASNFHLSEQANANKLKALQEKETYVQKIKSEVERSYHSLMSYKKQLAAKDVALKQAENEFNLAKLKYNIGDISKVDLETSKYNWENAKFGWLTSKINVAIKQSELHFACGYPTHI